MVVQPCIVYYYKYTAILVAMLLLLQVHSNAFPIAYKLVLQLLPEPDEMVASRLPSEGRLRVLTLSMTGMLRPFLLLE